MTKKAAIKKQNPVAKKLREDPQFKQKVIPNKKWEDQNRRKKVRTNVFSFDG